MVKRSLEIDWATLPHATLKRRRLSTIPNEDGYYDCPVTNCLKTAYKSIRGRSMQIERYVEITFLFYFPINFSTLDYIKKCEEMMEIYSTF